FAWTHENLTLCATHAGRTLALRSMALLPRHDADASLGRATRTLLQTGATRALAVVVDVLRERTLMTAAARLGADQEVEPLTPEKGQEDAALALSTSAHAQ